MNYDRTISPEDHMAFSGSDAYFRVTDSGAECILRGTEDAGLDRFEVGAVLDFGSGYGRVYRALPTLFPVAKCTALELIAPAARYCAETFGGDAVQSYEDLDRINLPRLYDVVWVGSVFTHLPEHRWKRLLTFLASNVRSGGVVIFTCHGERSLAHFESHIMPQLQLLLPEDFARLKSNLPHTGFEYLPAREQTAAHSAKIGMNVTAGEYGFTFNSEQWVQDYISQFPEWDLVSYLPAAWAGNHDVVTLRRS